MKKFRIENIFDFIFNLILNNNEMKMKIEYDLKYHS